MDLSLLGLNSYEAQAYEALMDFGESTASQVSSHSGVPYGRIYDVLSSLEQKGLLRVLPTSTKKYIPSSPQRLQELLEEKSKELKEIGEQLTSLSKKYEQRGAQAVEIARGHKNFYRIIKDMPPVETFDYAIKYTSEYRSEWARDTKRHFKDGIQKKVLARYDDETKDAVQRWLPLVSEQKILDNDGVAFSIRDTSVMIALIKSNTTLLIRDPAFISMMKQLFETQFEHSNPVPKE